MPFVDLSQLQNLQTPPGPAGYTGSQGEAAAIGYTGSRGPIGYTGSIASNVTVESTTALHPFMFIQGI